MYFPKCILASWRVHLLFRSSNVTMSQNGFQSNSVLKRKASSRAWYGRYNPEYLTRQADSFTSESWMFEALDYKI